MQLDEERKQELIMAKQIRRDTVVIQGGNTTTREISPFLQQDRSRSRQPKITIIKRDKSPTKVDLEAVKKATNPIALRYWNQCVQQSVPPPQSDNNQRVAQTNGHSNPSNNYQLDETGNVAPPWLQHQQQPVIHQHVQPPINGHTAKMNYLNSNNNFPPKPLQQNNNFPPKPLLSNNNFLPKPMQQNNNFPPKPLQQHNGYSKHQHRGFEGKDYGIRHKVQESHREAATSRSHSVHHNQKTNHNQVQRATQQSHNQKPTKSVQPVLRNQSADSRIQSRDSWYHQASEDRSRSQSRRQMTPTVEHNAALPYPVLIETHSSKSRSKPPLVTTASVDNPPFANGYSNSTANNNMEVGNGVQVNGNGRRMMKRITIKAQSRSSSLPPWSRKQENTGNGSNGETVSAPRRGAISPAPPQSTPTTSSSPLPWCRNGSPSRARLYATPPPWCRVRSPSPTAWTSNPPPWCRVTTQ